MADGTDQAAGLTPLKRAFLAIEELQARLEASERARHAPIAIVGAGCRLPGGVDSPDAFWALLLDGVDAIEETPPDRWDNEAYYDPDLSVPGKMNTRHGGFLRAVDQFDPQFFGIAPREAAAMDPQQRLLLEVTWEALENAGLAPARLAGTRTGVYVAITTNDYAQVHRESRGLEGLDAYYASGIAHSIASGRLSYVLGLEGPSLSIDTACSSSLVAVHLAVQSLRSGECRTALAGGVNLILTPDISITLSKYQMMAPDGRCKFGDARADGFVRAEGCAVVVLKRLSDALADGDPILAVIRGAAANQDGASSGLTAPNGPSQISVIRAGLEDAGVLPEAVGYIEAHGTGTALGDPIELQALGAVFGPGRTADRPLLVGSVKTNIGHMEATAGVAGLLKLALVLKHGEIPASLHFQTPNPHIDWDDLPVAIPTSLQPWPAGTGPRVGGVSSFGFSGTNIHLVLEEPPALSPAPQATEGAAGRPLHLLPLSARSATALRTLAQRTARLLLESPAPDLADVAFTAGTGRSHFAHRLAAVAADADTAARQLAAFAAGQSAPGLLAFHVESADPPPVVFLFTGQGAQYAGMGRALYEGQPVFRAALDRCAAILASHMDTPLLDLIFAEPGSEAARLLDQTTYTQPALVALEIALAELWRSWGVMPTAVMGHSVGEYAAAWLAGVLSLEDALALVAARGRLMGELPHGGAMAALFAPADAVEGMLAESGGQAVIAAYNGPEHTVVSGPADAVQALVDLCAARSVRAQRLAVSHAFHSPLLDPMLDALEQAAAGVKLNPPRLRLISNLTGTQIGREITQPGYWRQHARQPVRFAQGIDALARLGNVLFVEIGPHPTLAGMAKAVLPPGTGVWLPSLRKGRDDWQQILESAAGLYAHGGALDWEGFDRPYARRKLVLPTYPFERERYWVTPKAGTARRPAPQGEHPLLGRRLRSALKQAQFESEVSAESLDFLRDHRVFDASILPATAYIETALAAAGRLNQPEAPLREISIHAPLIVHDDESRTLQVIVAPGRESDSFEILSQGADDTEWLLHASGEITPAEPAAAAPAALGDLRARCTEAITSGEHYARLRAHGLDFGPSLRGVQQLWKGDGEILGRIELPAAQAAEAARFRIHPALLDASIQSLAGLTAGGEATYLPIHIEEVALLGSPGAAAWVHAKLRESAPGAAVGETLTGDVIVYDESQQPVATVRGLLLKRARRADLQRGQHARLDDWLYQVEWRPQPVAPAGPAFAAGPDALAVAAGAQVDTLAASLGLSEHQRMLDALEELSTRYLVLALERLGLQWEPGTRFAAAGLGVAAHYQRLLDRLLAMLVADGLLCQDAGGWLVARAPEPFDPAARWAALYEQHPAGRGELVIARRCGEQLAAALRGEVDPLQLIFPGGSTEAAEQMYQESPSTRFYNALAAEAVAAAAAGLAAGRTLRVLEIGAGTGGTTAHIAPRLRAVKAEYHFTDISPLFLARAAEKFRDDPFISFRTLDIELDPVEQGFAPHQYDIVVATNVLHATADLRRTFAHVATLLAPGGILVLLEMTRPQRFIDISFGLTPGWWKFADHDLRPDYLLLDRAQWLRFLADAGYGEPRAVPNEGRGNGADLTLQTLLLARAPDPAAAGTLPAGRQRWLILADATGTAESLAGLIAGRGGETALVTPGAEYRRMDNRRYEINPARPQEFVRVLEESTREEPWDGVAYLWGLDASDPVLDQAALETAQAHTLSGALHLAQALVEKGSEAQLYLVTRGAQGEGAVAAPVQATLWGFGKSLALEHPELRCVRVDLEPGAQAGAAGALLEELLAREGEEEIILRDGKRLVSRLARYAAPAAPTEEPVELVIRERGSLDNLVLRPAARRAPGPGEVEIRVAVAALNFKDVLNTLGMYPGDPGQPGSECAGTVVALGPGVADLRLGDRVVALAGNSFRSFLTAAADFVLPMPARLTFEEAITIPIAYVTAAYALQHLGGMRAGHRVLIHAAAGGVGLAAVHLAQRAGAEICATAGSPAKRDFLRGLGVQHVFDSRSLDFAAGVQAATAGEGVDLVLNSLAGEFISASLGLLRSEGHFLELGKRDHLSGEEVAALGRGITYHVIDWGETAQSDPALIRSLLAGILSDVEQGRLEPLPFQLFPLASAVEAFRTMAQARHIGKLVLSIPHPAGDQPLVRAGASYLITGGLGGLGLMTARRLVDRGARALILMGRSSPSPDAQAAIAEMEQAGARVAVVQGDVSNGADVASALATESLGLPPLRGIVHAAGVLDDGALPQQSWPRFQTVLAPKVAGAWHLHTQSREHSLDFFVLYSSVASLLGSRGQANHAAANSFLDALAHMRRSAGLPALSVNWGAWSEVGAAVAHAVGERSEAQGMGMIAPEQGLDLLERLLADSAVQAGVLPVDWPVFLRHYGKGTTPKFLSELGSAAQPLPEADEPAATAEPDILRRLADAPPQRRQAILCDYTRSVAGHVLAMHPDRIDDGTPLHALGLDSLMAVELRNLLGSGLALKRRLPATLVFDYPTIEAMAEYLATEMLPVPAQPAAEPPAPAPAAGDTAGLATMLEQLEGLSDDEVDRILAEKMRLG